MSIRSREYANRTQHFEDEVLSVILAPLISHAATKQLYGSKLPKAIRSHRVLLSKLYNRLSCKVRWEDALALRADERRDKLRKAAGRSKYPLIRRCLNGETRMSTPHASIRQSITYGREPPELKHLSRARKRKKIYRFPK